MDLRADYDEGYFDKDEQGWCARRVTVTTTGERVEIHRSGDDNGMRAYDETVVGAIGRRWPELGLVEIVDDRQRTLAYFDTRTDRLRTPGEQVVHHFPSPANYRDPGCLERGLAVIVPVIDALGLQPGRPPASLEIPDAVVSTSAGDAMERGWTVPGERGFSWRFLLREYGERSGQPPEFQVIVTGPGGWVSLYAGKRAMFLFIGRVELQHLAIAARDQAIARWCA